ncbi:MAG: GNAT family N-acetyltransferase [Pleurocapsa minor GSE-CHR-MK-17-07R]|jgi:ribosomal protein S18 acetylase RimI-like enzyme|nr:GNAT family N-acetyltransferase [Pleurocapsa minor GSE-CHR-MK 17-07R]
MIRPFTPEDTNAIIRIAVATNMFAEEDTGILRDMLSNHPTDDSDSSKIIILEEEGQVIGVAYYEPAPATDRAWYLTMIAVHPEKQAQGRGTLLMQHVEDALIAAGQRMLLVNTSGTPDYDRTRAFYLRCGYAQVAHIPDYWSAGDDLVVFCKVLRAN